MQGPGSLLQTSRLLELSRYLERTTIISLLVMIHNAQKNLAAYNASMQLSTGRRPVPFKPLVLELILQGLRELGLRRA